MERFKLSGPKWKTKGNEVPISILTQKVNFGPTFSNWYNFSPFGFQKFTFFFIYFSPLVLERKESYRILIKEIENHHWHQFQSWKKLILVSTGFIWLVEFHLGVFFTLTLLELVDLGLRSFFLIHVDLRFITDFWIILRP